VVPLEFAGIRAGTPRKATASCRRERFDQAACEYAATLATGSVIATASEREQRIRKALDAATRTIPTHFGAKTRHCSTRGELDRVSLVVLAASILNFSRWPMKYW